MLCYHCMCEKGDADVCPYCHEQGMPVPQAHHLPPGTVIGGRYTLGKVLGEGGFGITYIGKSNTLDITVAVKEYFPHGYCNRNATYDTSVSVTSGDMRSFFEKGRDRFLREAKTLARFQNEPGIVDVIDFVEQNNTAYIVMEYLDGVNLREYQKMQGTFDPVQAISMMMPMMRALEKVHAAGVIHRDISPDNIMMLRSGSLKLMDFGAARDYDGDNRSMSVMLKQGYAPEEQYRRNGEQGPWTDVYGVCACIYRLITGVTPAESLDRIHHDILKPPSSLGVAISPSLEKTLLYGLAVYKENRCPDMGTLLMLMEQSLNGEPLTMPAEQTQYQQQPPQNDPYQTVAAGTYIPPQQGYPGSSQPTPRQPQQQPRPPYNGAYPQEKKRSYAPMIVAISIAAAAIIAAVVAVIIMLNRDSGSPAPSGASSSSVSSSAASSSKADTPATEAKLTMPDLSGMTKENAIDKLAELNLTVSSDNIIEMESDKQSPGKVFNQVPKQGSDVNSDTKITLYIAKAKATEKPKPTEKPQSSSSSSPSSQVSSSSYVYCTADTYVALHESASTGSKEVRKIWKGQTAKYISSSNNMYYVESGGARGYASAAYLSFNYSDVPGNTSCKLYVNSNVDFLSLRESPSADSKELAKMDPGESMIFINSVVDNGGVNNGYHVQWARVQYGNQYGYVYDLYIHD